ncbi:hypothetical protein [Pseudonocardia acidicola]|uniref:Integral membrane protein n=1 Tax=Pseudonocardia acidicola TaxID=2724939 RepID=A0ABX1S5X8_9PSEU|nr:hypothetical protein [Pseudonocardia acidicola]NMH95761.1 hypothetical protein [Pseudonocardia acidicola]
MTRAGGPLTTGTWRERLLPANPADLYGLIVASAVMAVASETGSFVEIVASVLFTGVVFWLAEVYSRVLFAHVQAPVAKTWARIRAAFAGSSGLVVAAVVPLLGLLVAGLLGAEPSVAANAGLLVATALLFWLGWVAAGHAERHGMRRFGSAAVTAALGLVMIALKSLLHH